MTAGLGARFERFYGFLGGETHQYYPDLVYDNHQVEPPKTPEEGYHLTEDLVDKAISFVADSKQVAPDKPFFMYFCPGAMHAPHHVRKEWSDKYKGSSTRAGMSTAKKPSPARKRWVLSLRRLSFPDMIQMSRNGIRFRQTREGSMPT